MKLLISIASVLLFVGGLAGSSLASENGPSTPSPNAVAVLLLLVVAGSGSTGTHNPQP
jgi:4-hydroxybenzoate polyprenyltransferase